MMHGRIYLDEQANSSGDTHPARVLRRELIVRAFAPHFDICVPAPAAQEAAKRHNRGTGSWLVSGRTAVAETTGRRARRLLVQPAA